MVWQPILSLSDKTLKLSIINYEGCNTVKRLVVAAIKNSMRIMLLLLALGGSTVVFAQDDIKQLLDQINLKAEHVSFSGEFVHKQGDSEERLWVARVCDTKGHDERIVSLTGQPKEIVRQRERIWYYDPKQGTAMENVVANEHTGLSGLALSRKLQQNYSQLQKYYNFELGDNELIAGRSTSQIKIISKDDWRFGYHLWVDKESGLILRTDLYNQDWQLLESFVFEKVIIDTKLAEQNVLPSEQLMQAQKQPTHQVVKELPMATADWKFAELPPGYKVQQRLLLQKTGALETTEQFLIGDGVASVSVLIYPDDANMQQSSSMQWGAMNIVSRTQDGYKVTVIGEAPTMALQFLLEQLQLK